MKKILCPKCNDIKHQIKYGKTSKGEQRYQCKLCSVTYIINKSPTAGLSITNYKFKKIIGYMIDDVTLAVIARNFKIDIKTVHYYRYLVFHALSDYQDTVKLSGTILLDETFKRINEKQYKIVRPDGKGIRGLSFNQLCIITMIDLQSNSLAKVSSRAMPLPHHYIDLFNKNIQKPTRFIYDGNPKAIQFMNQFGVPVINSRKDISEEYSDTLIDSYHSNIKRYFFKHAGFKLKNTQHYLNFFVYRYNFTAKHKTNNLREQIEVKNKMIEDLFTRVKKTYKKITYRSYLNDLGITKILETR